MSGFNPADPTLDLDQLIKNASSISDEDLDDIVPLTDNKGNKAAPTDKEGVAEDDEEDDNEYLFDVDGDAEDDKAVTPRTVADKGDSHIADIRLQLKQSTDENAKLKEALDGLIKWKEEISTNAVNSVINSKESQRRQALRDGQIDVALALEDEIKAIKDSNVVQAKKDDTPPVDHNLARLQNFVNSNKSALDAALSKIHKLNFPDFEKVSLSRKQAMISVLQTVVQAGVREGKTVNQIAQDYADCLNLKTVKPVNRTSPKSNSSSSGGNTQDIQSRFNSLPKEARKMWNAGGYSRIYNGDLKAFVEDTEKSFRS